jgi:hypothetical protein
VKPPEAGDALRAKPRAKSLESYRRLVELQKQMIELSQQYEQSKRECAALREQVQREITQPARGNKLPRRLQQTAGRLLKRVPGWGSIEARFSTFNHKQVTSC